MKQLEKHYKPWVPYVFLACTLCVYGQHLHFISYMVVILLHIIWHCCNAAAVYALNEHKDVFNNYSDTFLR